MDITMYNESTEVNEPTYMYVLGKSMFKDTLNISTAQFKLDRTHMQHGLDMTCFSFCMCKHVCAHKIDDIKPTIQSFCVHTT